MSRRQNFRIAVWPGDTSELLQYNAEVVRVPGINEIADPTAEGSLYRYPSALDASGRPIPGTVVLRDITVKKGDGSILKAFDVDDWTDGLEQTARGRGQVNRGLRFVDSPEEVQAAKTEGRPKWVRAAIATWQALLQGELKRRSDLKRANQVVTESPYADAIREAHAGLSRYGAAAGPSLSDDALMSALGVSAEGRHADAEEFPGQHVTPQATQGDGIAIDASGLYRKAKELGVKLSPKQKEGLLEGNDAVIEEVLDLLATAEVAVQTKAPA